jgi:hypothetical protein
MQTLTPQGALLLRKTVAALAAVAALGLLFATQHVAATGTEATRPAEYFPAQFTIQPAADEGDGQIPTF